MNIAGLLADAFDRIEETALAAIDGLSVEQLAYRVDGRSNSIGWLVWHLTRIQDDHVSDVAGAEQAWTARGWVEQFGLPFERDATGFAQNSDDVAAVQVDETLLRGYLHDVLGASRTYLATLVDEDLDRIVDEGWDPPVSLGVRLVSVVSDDLQHAGQAALIRGILPG